MKKLDDSALYDIELLKEVVIPESIEKIGKLIWGCCSETTFRGKDIFELS